MVKSSDRCVVLIAGPTASGKSQAAIAIAERLNGIIVNADAMQVYRDLQILTARPAEDDLARAPHKLFGHVDAEESYSVGRWLSDVESILAEASAAGQLTIFVGGTGLYFKALSEGLSDIPSVPQAITARWKKILKEDGPWALHAVLMARDSETADATDPGDGQRIVRALAVREATGKSIRHFQSRGAKPLISADEVALRAVLMPDRANLYERIDARFEKMVSAGAVHEVKTLLDRNLDTSLPAMKAIGVPELAQYLAGELSLAAAIESAKTHSRRYAKRQMTWIRGQMPDWEQFTEPKPLIDRCLDLCAQQA